MDDLKETGRRLKEWKREETPLERLDTVWELVFGVMALSTALFLIIWVIPALF